MNEPFLRLLRATATLLSRFGQVPPPDGTRWEGAGDGGPGRVAPAAADALAAKWWGVFTALAGVLEGQGAPTPAQVAFIRQLLFGGAGSFEELVLDEGGGLPGAAEANQELDRLRAGLGRELGRG